jgi:ppGpp synthetase/RelA/SpoT-type nucleotidyltranferase
MAAALSFSEAFLDEFDVLYQAQLKTRLQPALTNLTAALGALLEDGVSASQRLRLRLDAGRIKSPNRVLLKAQNAKYAGRITSPSDVFNVIQDIVGTRVTCNTLSVVRAMIDLITRAATQENPSRTLVRLSDDWIDDYITTPKESGYRAINLVVGVPIPVGSTFTPILCEVQVRTLLQDAWGELTHEDTYKPGVPVPGLVALLSRRLADALAVLDDIAQDLRAELDRVEGASRPRADEQVISGLPEPAPAPAAEVDPCAAGGASPSLESRASDASVAPEPIASGEGSATQDQVSTPDDVSAAFRDAYERDVNVKQDLMAQLVALASAAAMSRVDLRQALLAERATIEKVAADHAVQFSDYGSIRFGILLHHDREKGLRELASSAATLQKAAEFRNTYLPGREFLGTVVRVDSYYALIELSEGARGILHYTSLKERPDQYVNVNSYVSPGDTVRVRVRSSDYFRDRIELELIKGDRPAK